MRSLRLAALAAALALLAGCAAPTAAPAAAQQRYEATFLTLFDTVTTILGYADSEDAFRQQAQTIHDELEVYHQLFDIYSDYEGVVNLKAVNDRAGVAPVQVSEPILDLLDFCLEAYGRTGGRVNVAMGSVLSLWHDAREAALADPAAAALPDPAALAEAMEHTDLSRLVIDREASTVYLADPAMSLDVGAVAKGWAVEQVCRQAPAGLLVSVGGNVRATGPKPDSSDWVAGIENPDGGAFLATVAVRDGSVVTSGDYQRYFTVDGVRYHHILDPDTGAPARYWRSVTVLCPDSGLADALSTALFTLPLDEGRALLDGLDAEALWVDGDGGRFESPGFADSIQN